MVYSVINISKETVVKKADMCYIMTRISDKTWNYLVQNLRVAAREGIIDPIYIENPDYRPTHVIDIYKMRRGRYKNVRIWTNLHLGTGRRIDLFMTTADNQPIRGMLDLFSSATEREIITWRNEVQENK